MKNADVIEIVKFHVGMFWTSVRSTCHRCLQSIGKSSTFISLQSIGKSHVHV